jgi:MFS family permease
MRLVDALWPPAAERALLGRFYIAEVFTEALNVVFPFQFVYLYLVMDRPEWAVLPLIASSAAVLAMEIPTGVVADRWGRKRSVIAGGLMTAFAWASIPLSVSLQGAAQLLGGCGAFLVAGIGRTMVSGAQEAWVVDNLVAAARRDLVDSYFARARSFASLGGIAAGCLATLILFTSAVDRSLLDTLWYIAALGLLLAVYVAKSIPERRPAAPASEPPLPFFQQTVAGVRTVLRVRPLFLLMTAVVIATFSGSVVDEAFDMSLVTKGMDARALAPLGILDDVIGMLAPLASVFIARALGATRAMALLLAGSAASVGFFFLNDSLWLVVTLFIVLDILDDIWDPIADTRLQALIPSQSRATISSLVNQLKELATMLGLLAFALLLGRQSDLLRNLAPSLIEAFSGGVAEPARMPAPIWGLQVPDFAIVAFVLSGLLAVPFIVASRRGTEGPS